mmetsp:Transcript_33191/g.105959  ORF Transcript_33191/g.105959 Transcript_33191/m.105959 type:complete len:290 (-) Transcript_33191:341-1210(-)
MLRGGFSCSRRWSLSRRSPSTDKRRSYGQVLERQYAPVWSRFAELTARLCPTESDGSWEPLLDVGSGPLSEPGLTIAKTMPHARVVLTDANEGTVALIKEAISALELPHVEASVADASALPFPDHSFDFVTCGFGIAEFHDRKAALKEMWRVLKPGCELIVSHWTLFEPGRLEKQVLAKLGGLEPPVDLASCAKKDMVQNLLAKHFDVAEAKTGSIDFVFKSKEEAFDAVLKDSLHLLLGAQADDDKKQQEARALFDDALSSASSDDDSQEIRLAPSHFTVTVAIKPPA